MLTKNVGLINMNLWCKRAVREEKILIRSRVYETKLGNENLSEASSSRTPIYTQLHTYENGKLYIFFNCK